MAQGLGFTSYRGGFSVWVTGSGSGPQLIFQCIARNAYPYAERKGVMSICTVRGIIWVYFLTALGSGGALLQQMQSRVSTHGHASLKPLPSTKPYPLNPTPLCLQWSRTATPSPSRQTGLLPSRLGQGSPAVPFFPFYFGVRV